MKKPNYLQPISAWLKRQSRAPTWRKLRYYTHWPRRGLNPYFIKAGYRCNLKPAQYRDTPDDALAYQLAVYQFATAQISELGLATVLDVGCGLGLKLKEFILPTGAAITGVDVRESIAVCAKTHTFGRWFVDNIEDPQANLGDPFDLIICADVIEHLLDPDTLLNYFRRWSHPKTHIILSTPERDIRRGENDMGPPGNGAHVREWNGEELKRYLVSHGLNIIDHRIVDLRPGMHTCQLAFCSWREMNGH